MMNIMIKKVLAITLVLAVPISIVFFTHDIGYRQYKKEYMISNSESIRLYKCVDSRMDKNNRVQLKYDDFDVVESLLYSCVKSKSKNRIIPPISPGGNDGPINKNSGKTAKFIVSAFTELYELSPYIVFYDYNEVIFTDENGLVTGRYTCSKKLYEKVLAIIQ